MLDIVLVVDNRKMSKLEFYSLEVESQELVEVGWMGMERRKYPNVSLYFCSYMCMTVLTLLKNLNTFKRCGLARLMYTVKICRLEMGIS